MLRQIARFLFLVILLIVTVAAAAAQEAAPPTATPAADAPPAATPAASVSPAGALPTPMPIPGSGGEDTPERPPGAPDCGPDLFPYTPSAYSYPVTPNSVKHTTIYDSVLYAGWPSFFDWFFANSGTSAVSGTFQVEVWVEGERIVDYPFTNFPNNAFNGIPDWQYTVPASGWKTVILIADADNVIAECDETNNIWQGEFYWEPVDGWWGEYYNNENLAGDPVFVRDDPAIQFEWLSDSPAPGIVNTDYFSIFWERDISFQAGTYLFEMSRDDGMRFWIDSGLKLDAWVHGVADHSVIVDLSQGTHTLELAVNELNGWAQASLDWTRCYSLSVTSNPAAGGDVAISTDPNCGDKYIDGTVVTLTAGPESGYTFSNWSGDVTGTANPRNVTMNGNKSVTANFTPDCFTLTTAVNPSGSGVVNPNPTPNCAGGKYTAGTVVALTAVANSGYTFANWTGAVTGTANPRNVTMDGDKSVTANFTPVCYTLTTAVNPSGSGVVNLNPAPNCAGGKYTAGTVVALTASANSGYTFTSWSGAVTGTANPRNVTMDGDKSVTANFTPVCYTLTTSVNPSGSGVVNLNPAPNCAGGKYTAGTVVALTASAGSGYTFANWSGDATGTANPRNVTMDSDKSVTANFTPVCYTLTLSVNPTDGGTVSPSLAPNCAGGKYIAGTVVTLTAVANAGSGYTFVNWSGDVSGTTNPRNVTLNGDRNVTANFNRQCYSLSIAVDPPGMGGTVLSNPAANCGGQYTAGTVVSLMAADSASYAFDHWSGDLSGTENPKSITMNGHRAVTAHYEELSVPCYALTLDHTGEGSDPQATPGQSAGCDLGDYVAGATIQLTADPDDGWHVEGWRGAAGNAATMSNNLIMPAAARTVWVDYVVDPPVAQRVALPMVLYGAEYGFPGPLEDEPNDDWDQANGPLVFGRQYQGYPDDRFDWYAFDLLTPKTLVIALENVTGDDPQLTLFYQTGNPEGWKAYAWAEPFTIIYPAQPGRYYVRVYVNGDFNATTLYRLRVSAP